MRTLFYFAIYYRKFNALWSAIQFLSSLFSSSRELQEILQPPIEEQQAGYLIYRASCSYLATGKYLSSTFPLLCSQNHCRQGKRYPSESPSLVTSTRSTCQLVHCPFPSIPRVIAVIGPTSTSVTVNVLHPPLHQINIEKHKKN